MHSPPARTQFSQPPLPLSFPTNMPAAARPARSGRLGASRARGKGGAAGGRATLDLGVLAGEAEGEYGADGRKQRFLDRLFGRARREEKREEKREAKEEKMRAARHGGGGAPPGGAGGARVAGEREAREREAREKKSVGGARASGKVAAASSLGSLQGYAQTTVKDGGPLQSCFRNSTSEVERVKRFVRPAGSGKGEEEADFGEGKEKAKRSGAGEDWGRGSGGGRKGFTAADAAASALPEGEGEARPEDALVFGEEVRKTGLMSARPEAFEYPNFALGEYGAPETWNSDVFVLVHNAVRWEIMDLYTIIGSLQRRWLTLSMRDLYDLAEFWEVFELFVAQSFEVEDQIVFPYLLGQAASSEKLATYYNSAKYSKEKLVGMLYDLGATIEMFNNTAPGDVFPSLYRQLVEFLPTILEYMETQDTILPDVFASHCDPEDRIMLNRAVANFLIRAAHGRDAIAILTRWIEDTMILQIWKDENLSARAKSSHAKWVKKLEANHTAIARRFQRRLRSGNPSKQLRGDVASLPQPGNPAAAPDRHDPSAAMPDRMRGNNFATRPISEPRLAPVRV